MRRQLVPGLVVRLTIIKAKTQPGIEANSYIHVLLLKLITCVKAICSKTDTIRLFVPITYLLIIIYILSSRDLCAYAMWFL